MQAHCNGHCNGHVAHSMPRRSPCPQSHGQQLTADVPAASGAATASVAAVDDAVVSVMMECGVKRYATRYVKTIVKNPKRGDRYI